MNQSTDDPVKQRRFFKTTVFKVAAAATAAGIILTGCNATVGSNEQAKLAPTPDGKHCLDESIGGLHTDLYMTVKQTLHDPASMSDMHMRLFPKDSTGKNAVLFTFRARNGQATMQLYEVGAFFQNADCKLLEWKFL